MRKYENLGFSPENAKTDFCNDIHGICHDEYCWYVSQGSAIKKVPADHLNKELCYIEVKQPTITSMEFLKGRNFYKYYQSNSSTTPVGFKIDGLFFGDIDYYKGYLFVPASIKNWDSHTDSHILVFSTKTFDCVCCQPLYKKGSYRFQKMVWCAVNPQDDCLYTSDGILSSSFDGCKSPVMAFKINFENLGKKQIPVFTCVNENGIALKRKVKINTNNPEMVPYNLASGIKAGCFDPFDTLYLYSDSGSRQEHDGVTAFILQRELESTVDKFIRDRAYFIWEEKGRPLQSDDEKKQDWNEAIWQIGAVVQSGLKKYDGPAYAGYACVKNENSDSTDQSLIDLSLNGKQKEEVGGIIYWDNRCYISNADSGFNHKSGNLHILKWKNDNESSFSMQNFALKNFETLYEVISYNPESLEIRYNKVSNRWVIVSRKYIPVKAFDSESEARNALPVFSQFKSLVIIGRCGSNEETHDLIYDFLSERCSKSVDLKSVKREIVHFDSFQVEKMCCIAENKWKSDYAFVMELCNCQKFNEKHQIISLPIHNEDVAPLIKDIIMLESSYSKQNGGYLNYILSSSNRQKDNLYWFD